MSRLPTFALAALAIAAAGSGTACAHPRESQANSWSYSVQLIDESGQTLPAFQQGGRTYVLGALGQRYRLRVHNKTGRRIEVVASVDGRDVVDGKPSAFKKRGYLVEPYGDVVIDGYRLNETEVAAFRFSSVPRSYAALSGSARDVGVIGVAVFPERFRTHPPHSLFQPQAESADRAAASSKESEAPAPASSPAASGMMAKAAPAPESRPGLGTEFGEVHGSQVTTVPFERASSEPASVLTLRYNDRRGLTALGIDLDPLLPAQDDAALRASANPFRRDPSYAEPPPGWSR